MCGSNRTWWSVYDRTCCILYVGWIFVVYFTTMFIQFSYNTDIPELWAGMGRAVNNAGAVITSFTSVLLLSSANTMIISVVALVLFALISVAIYAYSTQLVISVKEPVSTEPAVNYKLERFVQAYSLTEREKRFFRY